MFFKTALILIAFSLLLPLLLSFSTALAGTVTDIDGNVYQTVIIGTQEWMAENLKVTHYCNGDAIPNVTDDATWRSLSTGAYRNYNDDVNNVATYGRLYNWYAAVDSRNVAPAGWHVPSDTEWKQLEMYLGMSQAQADSSGWRGTDQGGRMKEIGTIHWWSPNTGATNASGFSALPAGNRGAYGFGQMRYEAYFWSSTPYQSSNAFARVLSNNNSRVQRGLYNSVGSTGFSVRCVREAIDSDGDGIPDAVDNCPTVPNPDQLNTDSDGEGNVCDLDDDNDGVPDVTDINSLNPNICADADADGCDDCAVGTDDFGPMADNLPANDGADADADGICDAGDNCPLVSNPDQLDTDHDNIGDACDYICGDASGDKTVDISDAVSLIAYIFSGGPAPAPLEAGDANCDGMVDISDAVYLIAYIFSGGAAPCALCK